METEPAGETHESQPPESDSDEPVAPVPTNETRPVWAQAKPAGPAGDEPAPAADEPAPPTAIKKGDPNWSETEASDNGDAPKKTPEWAQTVPTSPGEPIEESTPPTAEAEEVAPPTTPPPPAPAPGPVAAHDMWDEAATEPPEHTETVEAEVTPAPLNEAPKAVAADALKSTWPPRAESASAAPAETDIWPPEPPTERAMPAWPPPSELEEPATPAQAIPSWPGSLDPAGAATASAATPEAPEAEAPAHVESEPVAPVASTPPTPIPATPAPVAQTAPPTEPETIPPGPQTQQVAPAISPAPPAEPAAPAPSRPAWAPGPMPAQPAASSAPREQSTVYQVPAWAPRVPLASEPGTPTWFSPKEQIPHSTSQPLSQPTSPQPPPAPAPPVAGGHLPVAPIPKPEPAPAPAATGSGKPTWQVVEQRQAAKGPQGPTAEDRSYAEWFAWAKRGGAPASACHAAAQGAFKALSSGKDVTTAVQWATAAMSRPPENVSYARQTYCAWFALANIDLNLDQHRSHAFAGGAVQALDAGADASQAHAAGLAAAGIR